MKKVLVLAAAMMAVVFSAKAEVEFAYDAGFDIVSAYLWRGQYNGGLSVQPDLEFGFDGEHTSFRIGAWGNVGASDWTFRKDAGDGSAYTYFVPELDIVGRFSACGLSVGFNHYYYCDGSNFFSWKKVSELDGSDDSSTTEVWAGYNFGHWNDKAGLYFNWYTTVAGQDLVYDDANNPKRAWSSYFEVGYDYTIESIGLTLGAVVGMSPWESPLYGNDKFAVTNVSVKLNQEWEFEHVTLDLYCQASLNTDGLNKSNVVLWKEAGDDKIGNQQKLNACAGFGIWF